MSEENVEIARRFFEAGQRSLGAFRADPTPGVAAFDDDDLPPEIEAMLAFLHPNVEFNPVHAALEGGSATGHREYLQFWESFLSEVEDLRLPFTELTDLGDDRVLVAGEMIVKYKVTGLTLSEPRFSVLTLCDRQIVRFDTYSDRQHALAAIGLSGQERSSR
jgi:ketosteroid isomerase-like protein